MQPITKGQLINLLRIRRDVGPYFYIDGLLNDLRLEHDHATIKFNAREAVKYLNESQISLLAGWGIIESEPKFKEGDYIIFDGEFIEITKIDSISFWFKNITRGTESIFIKGSPMYNQSRLATPEEIALIKLELGSYIYHPDFGVGKIILHTFSQVECIRKDGSLFRFLKDGQIRKELKIATPEQIKEFHCMWNTGKEEAKKYSRGQPCLVSGFAIRYGWQLRYADGFGTFYIHGRKDLKNGGPETWQHHMPLNEITVKYLPVNE